MKEKQQLLKQSNQWPWFVLLSWVGDVANAGITDPVFPAVVPQFGLPICCWATFVTPFPLDTISTCGYYLTRKDHFYFFATCNLKLFPGCFSSHSTDFNIVVNSECKQKNVCQKLVYPFSFLWSSVSGQRGANYLMMADDWWNDVQRMQNIVGKCSSVS